MFLEQKVILNLSIIFILSVKRSHHARREGLKSHINRKKRKIYTIGFYEDMKVYINKIHKFIIKIRKSK
jgi:hypothetical protein